MLQYSWAPEVKSLVEAHTDRIGKGEYALAAMIAGIYATPTPPADETDELYGRLILGGRSLFDIQVTEKAISSFELAATRRGYDIETFNSPMQVHLEDKIEVKSLIGNNEFRLSAEGRVAVTKQYRWTEFQQLNTSLARFLEAAGELEFSYEDILTALEAINIPHAELLARAIRINAGYFKENGGKLDPVVLLQGSPYRTKGRLERVAHMIAAIKLLIEKDSQRDTHVDDACPTCHRLLEFINETESQLIIDRLRELALENFNLTSLSSLKSDYWRAPEAINGFIEDLEERVLKELAYRLEVDYIALIGEKGIIMIPVEFESLQEHLVLHNILEAGRPVLRPTKEILSVIR